MMILLAVMVGAAVQAAPPMTREQAIEKARSVLAQQLQLPVGGVEAREVSAVEWPDSGIGCGAPGGLYAQVITPGFRVVLAAAQKIYRVHVGGGRAVVCGEGMAVTTTPTLPRGEPLRPDEGPVSGPTDPRSRQLVTDATSDLASRLGVPAAAIALVGYQDVTWPDRSLGCPRPGLEYPQVSVEGVRIRLATSGRAYEYHAGGGRAPFLCEPVGDMPKR
jgi:hypothetical protein